MGIFGAIKNTFNSIVTTVKEAVAPRSAQKVSSKTETIPMVSEKTQAQQTNEDKVEIKRKTKNNAYKLIEELCADNNIDINEAKKAQLLEKVTGFSSEELANKNEKELEPFINALKSTISNRKWAFWKSNSGEENLNKIAKSANDKYTDIVTGRGLWDNVKSFFKGNPDLAKQLRKAGFNEINEASVKALFQELTAEAKRSGDHKKIQEAYIDAFKTLGELLQNTKNPEHKALLAAAIPELRANVRTTAAKLSITSCMNNQNAKQKVARGIGNNLEAISGKDALGERISQNDNIEIAQLSFQNMTEEDSITVLDNMAARRRELAKRVQNGEILSEDESYYFNEAQCAHYSGALVGTSCNNNISDPSSIIGKIDTDTETFGIREKVYSAASEYVESHQDKLPITSNEFTKKVDKVTNGNYSKVIESKNESKETTDSKTQQNNSETKTSAKDKEITNTSANNITNTTLTGEKTYKTNKAETHKTTSIPFEKPQKREVKTEKAQTQTTQPVKKENTPKPMTSEEAIQGGVKAIKKYAKENKVNTFELAIDSLNSNNLSSSAKQWALNEFERAESSLQKLNFQKITNGSNALAAAKVMDENTRSELTTFRSYEIKKAVENIDKKQTA